VIARVTVVPVHLIQVSGRVRRDLGDIDTLARSIAEVGLLHPIVVDKKNRLLAGARRLEAVRRLKWKEVPVHVVGDPHEHA